MDDICSSRPTRDLYNILIIVSKFTHLFVDLGTHNKKSLARSLILFLFSEFFVEDSNLDLYLIWAQIYFKI